MADSVDRLCVTWVLWAEWWRWQAGCLVWWADMATAPSFSSSAACTTLIQ